MNKKIKPTVYRICKEDKKAREDDWYLIFRVIQDMCKYDAGSAFMTVLQGMKYRGISFEAITRQRRKFLEENPQYRESNIEDIRRKEEEEYILDNMKHIPRIDYNL